MGHFSPHENLLAGPSAISFSIITRSDEGIKLALGNEKTPKSKVTSSIHWNPAFHRKMTLENVSYIHDFMTNIVSGVILHEKHLDFDTQWSSP